MEDQFRGCNSTRELFNSIAEKIFNQFYDAKLIPKKNYLSFAAIREFAAIDVRSNAVRVGMDLGNLRFTNDLRPSNIKDASKRISHMKVIAAAEQFDETVNRYLRLSYYRTHN